ncbi:hypothetical protein IAI27_11190, partial [Streptococcus pseudopneumoniae]|uniref:hypothetical protein n=1 Tax=Streptococcus pseudopneumoniae TaxID=257758 RepID=UPI0018B0ED35
PTPSRDALVEALREALELFAMLAEQYDPPEGDDGMYLQQHDGDDLNIGHLRRARQAYIISKQENV